MEALGHLSHRAVRPFHDDTSSEAALAYESLIDMLYLKLKSERSTKLEHNTIKLEEYLRADRSTLNTATKTISRLLRLKGELYQRAKQLFQAKWESFSKDIQQSIDMDVVIFQAHLNKLQKCCQTSRHDAYCRHLTWDNKKWNVERHYHSSKGHINGRYPVISTCRQLMQASLHGSKGAAPMT
eukprot:366396-Amphidinium_carterae.1